MKRYMTIICVLITAVIVAGCIGGDDDIEDDEDQTGNGQNGLPQPPEANFAQCKNTAANCAMMLMTDPVYDCTDICKTTCSTLDGKDIISGEGIESACQETSSACGYCMVGNSEAIQEP